MFDDEFANVYGQENWESDEEFLLRFERNLQGNELINADEYCGALKEEYGWNL